MIIDYNNTAYSSVMNLRRLQRNIITEKHMLKDCCSILSVVFRGTCLTENQVI